MNITVVIIHPHLHLRRCLKAVLQGEPDIHVRGEGGTGQEALNLTAQVKPQVVVLADALPDLTGLELAPRLLAQNPAVAIIILTPRLDPTTLSQASQAGIKGCVPGSSFTELLLAIHQVAQGQPYPPSSRDSLADAAPHPSSPAALLTPRERQVLQRLADGQSTGQIAAALFISTKTVESHRQRLMAKLNIHTIAGLTKFALRENLTSL